MKERERLNERRAIAPVISALILSAVVLTVGGIVWAFSQGAMTISAEDYAESVIEMTDTTSERFIIEHVAYVSPDLKVWIYNYGSVDIDVKIEVGDVNGDYTLADDGTPAGSGGPIPVVGGIGESTFTTGDGVNPTAITVTAPDTTATFTAALYDASDTLLAGPIASTAAGTSYTVDLGYGYVASTVYVVKITAATENHPDYWIDIMAGGFEELPPLSYTATSGDELVIRAYTRRGNNAYYRYIVP